ncbi:MAG: hypothetical protein GY851_17255 [bacterium]|nr:hypothetical protein [bacterium]
MRVVVLASALIHAVGVVHAAEFVQPVDPACHVGNVTLEMSLKPFRDPSDAYVAGVCEELFRQWWPLTRHADRVSVLLWTADGSEILEYDGNMDAPLEWARYIGTGNSKYEPGTGPDHLSLHQRAYWYTENPPAITYGDLKRIIGIIKRVGVEVTGKPIRVGATFDPGPEFAKSDFKYTRHPEICMGNTMGKGTFVCSYSVLHADDHAYAGFPEGIPEGTPFGTFFGRQCKHFLDDLAFDYIWLSNGFGFGLETWGATGAVFNGEQFDTGKIAGVREKILDFWKLFRAECPDTPIETRGTNLSTGMDLAADGVPLRSIYRGGFHMAPPPNSPWAALDGDFGLELVGYMSSIAELPGDEFPFRYYTHDPWWLNSPWLDRYGREPHDIYLPMSISRIDAAGQVRLPTSILFLTVDNSYGGMPVEVPNEVIPHILRARTDSADQPGPVVWAYPFDEYHDMTFGDPPRVDEVLFGDWFMRQAVNAGFPINTVVSTANLIASLEAKPGLYAESVLVSIVPDGGAALEQTLTDHVRNGGRVLLYGPVGHASDGMLAMLNVRRYEPISGGMGIEVAAFRDVCRDQAFPTRVQHRPLTCAGGVTAIVANDDDPATTVIASVKQENAVRAIALIRREEAWNGGALAWIRGTNSNYYRKGGRLLANDNANEWFAGEVLARYTLAEFGYEFGAAKRVPAQRNPLVCVARNRNAFVFSGYCRDTTVDARLRFPQGAPVLVGYETRLDDGRSVYRMPRAWHRECRVFVDGQQDGTLACSEQPSVQYGVKRRLRVTGLDHATVRFYPEPGSDPLRMFLNAGYPFQKGAIEFELVDDPTLGRHAVVRDVTGRLTIAW